MTAGGEQVTGPDCQNHRHIRLVITSKWAFGSVSLFRFVQPCGLMREQARQPFEFPPVVTMVNKANKGKRAWGGTFVPCELDQSPCFLVFGCRWFTGRESPWRPSWSSCGPWPRHDGQGTCGGGPPEVRLGSPTRRLRRNASARIRLARATFWSWSLCFSYKRDVRLKGLRRFRSKNQIVDLTKRGILVLTGTPETNHY